MTGEFIKRSDRISTLILQLKLFFLSVIVEITVKEFVEVKILWPIPYLNSSKLNIGSQCHGGHVLIWLRKIVPAR